MRGRALLLPEPGEWRETAVRNRIGSRGCPSIQIS